MRRTWPLIVSHRQIFPYLFSIVSTAAVTAGLYFIRDRMEIAVIVLLYLLPVGASAALGGLVPGIIAALVAFFSLNYFFLPPYGTFIVHQSQDILVLVVFLVLAVSISQLVGRMMRNLALAHARERETTRLYELSLALSRPQGKADILHSLAQHILETFLAEQVAVHTTGEQQTLVVRPQDALPSSADPEQSPTAIISLQGRQQVLGEIQIWRPGQPFSPAEERLLRTYASQGALAVEGAILAEQARQSDLLQAEEKLQASLLNSISHDLRTPLVSITGALSSLKEQSQALNKEARDSLLDTAREEAERLNRLVGNILNMTRIEAGAIHLNRELCDIQDVIGAALEQLGERIARRQITINIPSEMDLAILDIALFEQVLVNLIDNAVKYSTLDTLIEINVSKDQNLVRIEVCDRGIGIPCEDLERVFDKFYRVHRPGGISGTGLGLAICKGIVEAHDGKIMAENRAGGGTIIKITLPGEVSS